MKKLYLIFSIVFTILTFAGARYVILGKVNAGYALIPMVWTLIFILLFRTKK